MSRISAIVLAAGRSRRMGSQKLLLPWAGQTVVGHIVDQALEAGVDDVQVVVGGDGPAVARALAGRAVRLVNNPDPDGDMLSSVRCGLRGLAAACEATFVLLGDQPMIRAALLKEMIEAFAARGGIVVPVHDGRRGHPLLLAATYREEVLASYDGVGLRGLLEAHGAEVHEVAAADAGVLSDMDVPEDYRREVARFREETQTRP